MHCSNIWHEINSNKANKEQFPSSFTRLPSVSSILQNLSTETLLELERNRRIQAEAQIQTILEMNRSMEAQGAGSEDSGILTLHRQLLSLKLKVSHRHLYLQCTLQQL